MNEHNDTELAQKVVTLQSRVRELEAERDRLATDFVHREKMAGLGQLAAGIAHEINNPIGFLTSNLNTMNEYCEMFKRILASYERVAEAGASGNSVEISQLLAKTEEMKKNEDIAYVLEDVESLLTESLEGVQRVRDIVVNLRNFARLDESDLKAADINDCIDQTLRVVWNELKYKCEVVKELDKLPQIPCYPGQINQVLMNLLVNAAQAISEKGTIGIRTRIDGQSIVIRVSDSGDGIPPENLTRLFDPFFTTKPVGQGTGLGLSIVHGIVENHRGQIDVESEVGKGTTFTIKIPIEGVGHV